ncbi:hypothetical protein GJV04_00765 [Enterobacteriaceae bacterium RIT714]|jgi:hypothetical protein|uniref:putative holin n=1 Tax=Lelliottia sp. CFBP8978 TaxID=3096522 RepID=UPI0012ACBA1E|nr:putative holin [Lelliottia sp. CFBP8978]MDY1035399.1 putative holin [Lelliottia sp. CFBP8978]MRS88571.1 hypothetical protein [Enterobacteriaceae bacterium RIT714]
METSQMKIMMRCVSLLTTSPLNPWVFIAAFAGSIIFSVTDKKHSHWSAVALFVSSMIIGITSSDFAAAVLSHFISQYTGLKITVPQPVGATVSAVISVRLLTYLNRRHRKEKSFLARLTKNLKK